MTTKEPGHTTQYLELHKHAHELLTTASQMSAKVYIFAALTIPKAEKFAKDQDYEAAADELRLVEEQIKNEQSKPV